MQYLTPDKDPLVFESFTLKNGIKVFYRDAEQTFGLPKVACSVVVKVGGRDDKTGKEGAAHFFEHMPFRGTTNFPNLLELTHPIEKNGGYINAFTTDEATGYEIIVPATMFEDGVKRVADMLLNPIMREEDIEVERQVILEELRNKNAQVGFYARTELFKRLLGNHPVVHAVIGTEDALMSIKKPDLLALHGHYYNADNIALFFAGMVTRSDLETHCEKYFGAIKSGEATKRNVTTANRQTNDYEVVLTPDKYNRSVYLLGRSLPPMNQHESMKVRLFRNMLTRGMNSPLHIEIREKRGLAYNQSVHHMQFQDVGLLMFFVSTRFHQMDEVDSVIWQEVNKILHNQERFDEVKYMIKQHLLHSEYDLDGLASEAINQYLDYETITSLNDYINVLEQTTLEDTRALMSDYLKKDEFINIRVDCDSKQS